MKSRSFLLASLLAIGMACEASAQTGAGTLFFYGTHHYADQVLEPYPVGGLTGWYLVRPPTPASYYSFSNILDVHSITVTKNGRVLTSIQQPGESPADYGYFVLSSFTQSSMVVIILSEPVLPTDRLRVSYDYVQQ